MKDEGVVYRSQADDVRAGRQVNSEKKNQEKIPPITREQTIAYPILRHLLGKTDRKRHEEKKESETSISATQERGTACCFLGEKSRGRRKEENGGSQGTREKGECRRLFCYVHNRINAREQREKGWKALPPRPRRDVSLCLISHLVSGRKGY